jgi:hypothetical protein
MSQTEHILLKALDDAGLIENNVYVGFQPKQSLLICNVFRPPNLDAIKKVYNQNKSNVSAILIYCDRSNMPLTVSIVHKDDT